MRILCLIFLILNTPSGFAAGVTGQLKSTTDDYPYQLGPPTQTLVPYVSLELSEKYKLRKSIRAQWKIYALTNTSTKYSPENFYGDVPEAFVEMKSGDSKLRVGMNTVNWGVVDVSSPSDVVNTLAIFHPLRSTKQGAPMIDASVGPETFNLDLLYIPVQRPPQLPSKDSRWLPREVLLNVDVPGLGAATFPKTITYDYTTPKTESRALNNNYGAKLSSHLGSWDFQVTHFEGAAPAPKLLPNIVLDSSLMLETPVALTPIYYRVRTTGFGFVWAREKWIYRGETAYQHTISKDDFLQPWSWTSVLAAETNVDMGSTTVTLLAQGYYTQNPQTADNLISSAYRIFDRTAVLGARWAYSENLTIMLSGLYETQTKGLFAMASFDNKLSDHLRWGLTWRNFSAEKDGLIKTFSKNSHGSMDLTYFF